MTGSPDQNDVIDAKLMSYLDGALEPGEHQEIAQNLAINPELAQRLAVLERGGHDFKGAFEPLLNAAPEARMQDMLAGLIAETTPQTPPVKTDLSQTDNVVPLRPAKNRFWSNMAGMAAAAGITLAVFSGGVYTGWQTGDKPSIQQTKIGWRQAAAQYISLYNKQTLDGLPVDRKAQGEGLQRVSQALGLSLTREKSLIDSLVFRGTQILQLKGKPLAQIAYLHNGETPVALCIIKSNKPSSNQKTEERLGLNIVHWISGGHGYMLIGKVPEKELEQIASPLVARFS